MGQVLSKIRPHSLRRRISNDLKLAHADKKRDFREHCLPLARALALLYYNGSNAEKNTDVPKNNIGHSDDSHGKKLNAWKSNCPHPNFKKQTYPKKKRHKSRILQTAILMRTDRSYTTLFALVGIARRTTLEAKPRPWSSKAHLRPNRCCNRRN